MTTFLPWWVTAISLATITLGFYFISRNTLGVSGSWARLIQWKDDKVLDEASASFANQPKLFEDALMAATIQQFGAEEVNKFLESRHSLKPIEKTEAISATVTRTHWSVHLVFLLALIIGGIVGGIIKGNVVVTMDLGTVHQQLFGTGFASIMTLFVGGLLVGFGTQLGGGCTSGHGLSGVSRLVPSSLVATASFFGAAIVFSMLINYFA